MAKRRHHEEQEIPFVALMDTMTNVVGVLIIVLVLVGISVASAVKKILSDLPPVTKEQLEELQKIMAAKKEIPNPEDLQQKIAALEENVRKGTEDLATLDKSAAGMNLANIPDLEKQMADKKAERDKKRAETETLLA
jgi:Tfp pilus assembly protein PilN